MYCQYQNYPALSNWQPFIIEVIGESEMAVAPDLAVVNIGVITEGKDLLLTQQQNSYAMNNVIQALIQLGLPHKQLQTFDYLIDSQYDFQHGKQLFRGYKVTHLLQVTIGNFSLIGKMIDTAVQHGANYVAKVQFSSSSIKKQYQRALSLSIQNALQKAQTIANILKIQLYVTPVYLIEGSKMEHPVIPRSGIMVKGMTYTQFEPGQQLIKATVTVFFHFNPFSS